MDFPPSCSQDGSATLANIFLIGESEGPGVTHRVEIASYRYGAGLCVTGMDLLFWPLAIFIYVQPLPRCVVGKEPHLSSDLTRSLSNPLISEPIVLHW